MVKKFATNSLLLLSFVQFCASAAVIVWDNGGPSATLANGTALTEFQSAQDFILGSTTDLTSVTFWNLEPGPPPAGDYNGSIFWEIRNNNAGAPTGSVLGSGTIAPTRTAAGTLSGLAQFQNDFTISINGVTAGTYWLTLHNGPLGNTGPLIDFYWTWADLNVTNTPTFRGQDSDLVGGGGYLTNGQEHAFNISGNVVVPSGVPEPATMAVAGAGLAALAFFRARKSNN